MISHHAFLATVLGVAVSIAAAAAADTESPSNDSPTPTLAPPQIEWLTDYGRAMEQAQRGNKMLLIYFYENEPSKNQTRFERESLANLDIARKLADDYVAVKVPLNYQVSVEGKLGPLLAFPAFADLQGRPGVVIVDYVHEHEDYAGLVVSVMPFDDGKYYRFDPAYVGVLLDLPPGTLTQRTMIFAVRIHPEEPASTRGRPNRLLFTEARDHSSLQARIRLQGHHNWGHRFQRITKLLGGNLRAQEVVAESWPGENLVDAAVDCVDCWRQSPGHWGAVSSDHPQFGYDIQRGENGIWYATGLFGNSGE